MSSEQLDSISHQIDCLNLELENNPCLTSTEVTGLKKQIQKLQNQINSTLSLFEMYEKSNPIKTVVVNGKITVTIKN